MRGISGLALAVAVLMVAPAQQTAQEPTLVAIVNKANPVTSLTLMELRRIFMKQSRMWPHGESIVPVDWDATSPIRESFSRRILQRSVRDMADYWVQQSVTQGLAPPSTHRSSRRRPTLRGVGDGCDQLHIRQRCGRHRNCAEGAASLAAGDDDQAASP